ncbi:hypothetical protein GLOIN_2v1765707 [Rhizophagus irregularis DAOM 181602=DAOM 197198]|nr:hypothetical protein GLOIN_2v1765707 [Rhizophagus irregularis DAOM 181602=DAOM 197198]
MEVDEERAKLLLTWIQDAISSGQLRDPGVPKVKWFNTFLKKDRLLPETDAMTIASKALRHSPDNHASPAQNYTIVNFRLREQPYDQAMAFELFDEN